jgi:hypothetical protein
MQNDPTGTNTGFPMTRRLHRFSRKCRVRRVLKFPFLGYGRRSGAHQTPIGDFCCHQPPRGGVSPHVLQGAWLNRWCSQFTMAFALYALHMHTHPINIHAKQKN